MSVFVGKTRVGRYELGRTLGEGTFGKVKFARNVETGENVAIKILDKEKVLKHKMIAQVWMHTRPSISPHLSLPPCSVPDLFRLPVPSIWFSPLKIGAKDEISLSRSRCVSVSPFIQDES